ncbi:MAG: N-acetyltransferase GCN5 [Pirellulaceae bacterium]|nr:MAG: N-acetyltransferase GCN5 [Pirellulaceae bacterium]
MTSYLVRQAHPDDIPALVEFQIALAWESESLVLDRNTVHRGVSAVFEDSSKGQYLVAHAADPSRLIGSLLLTYEWSDWRNGCVIWIQSVYVVPEWRRRGVFRTLYRYVQEQVASRPPYVGIRLYVDTRNTVAQKVYRQLGMRGDHYQVWEWFPDGKSSESHG